MTILAQPYAMLWELFTMNFKIKWVFTNFLGWALGVTGCLMLLTVSGFIVGFWRFRVAWDDVTMDSN